MGELAPKAIEILFNSSKISVFCYRCRLLHVLAEKQTVLCLSCAAVGTDVALSYRASCNRLWVCSAYLTPPSTHRARCWGCRKHLLPR